jgi:hypothetical protein
MSSVFSIEIQYCISKILFKALPNKFVAPAWGDQLVCCAGNDLTSRPRWQLFLQSNPDPLWC